MGSARDDSHCSHSLGACVNCSAGGSPRLFAGGDDDPFDLVSSVVVFVVLIGPLSDVSMSSVWSTCANSPTCALNRWRRRENVLKNAIAVSDDPVRNGTSRLDAMMWGVVIQLLG